MPTTIEIRPGYAHGPIGSAAINYAAGPFYLAMEYIQGKTLADVLQEAGRVPWPEVMAWSITLCDVLGYLHSQTPPFVFRDVKLEKVLLDSRTQLPVLIDFASRGNWSRPPGRRSVPGVRSPWSRSSATSIRAATCMPWGRPSTPS